jgi:hypothetical protein
MFVIPDQKVMEPYVWMIRRHHKGPLIFGTLDSPVLTILHLFVGILIPRDAIDGWAHTLYPYQ